MNGLPSEEKSGWAARLELLLGQRQGRTVLLRRQHQGPFLVQKALYPEGDSPCHLILLHPPGGMAAGDTLALHLQMEEGSHLLLTTPGAGKWYRSSAGVSRQELHLQLAPQAVVEWLPQENIFFSGCHAHLSLQVTLAEQAVFLGLDMQQFGRRASGERFPEGIVRQRCTIHQGERLLWREQGALQGGSPWQEAEAGLAGFAVSGSLLLAGVAVDDALLQSCRALPVPAESRCGLTRLPHLLHARILTQESEPARHWLRQLWQHLRVTVLQRPALLPRIWST
ncbi:MAG: urease accessory protein UreD [Magnetococcales bacterium]|nr:urease accessory protein UreD [Magnetococcales bacterium]MBF0115744.1 urease accessory protein UreD [Magnetococcales bacterium]